MEIAYAVASEALVDHNLNANSHQTDGDYNVVMYPIHLSCFDDDNAGVVDWLELSNRIRLVSEVRLAPGLIVGDRTLVLKFN